MHPPWVKKKRKKETKKFRLDSNDFSFISAGVSNVLSYKRNIWYNLSCLLQTYCRLSIIEKLFVSWQVFWDLLWQWLEEGCRKSVLGVCVTVSAMGYVQHAPSWHRLWSQARVWFYQTRNVAYWHRWCSGWKFVTHALSPFVISVWHALDNLYLPMVGLGCRCSMPIGADRGTRR